jgi:hypothetical protein
VKSCVTSKFTDCGIAVVVVFLFFKTVSPHVGQDAQVFTFILGMNPLGIFLDVLDPDFRLGVQRDKVRLDGPLQLDAGEF